MHMGCRVTAHRTRVENEEGSTEEKEEAKKEETDFVMDALFLISNSYGRWKQDRNESDERQLSSRVFSSRVTHDATMFGQHDGAQGIVGRIQAIVDDEILILRPVRHFLLRHLQTALDHRRRILAATL